MPRTHRYDVEVTWRAGDGPGTTGYRDYDRAHLVSAPGKPDIPGTADPAFRGVPERWNPEELLVVSLSQCHMLWFLALCAQQGIVVTEYADRPHGTMAETPGGSGAFTEVVLRPEVVIADPGLVGRAEVLHERAHEMCFIANSVNFPVRHEATVKAG